MSIKYFVTTTLLFLLSFTIFFSQENNPAKYVLATSFEKSGDYKNAARMYKELLDSYPNSDKYFDAVVRTYKALNQYQELKTIIFNKIKRKKTYSLYSLFGEVLWKTGFHNEAKQAWNNALENYPDKKSKFLTVAASQFSQLQIDLSINTLVKGREALGDENLFAHELSQYYIALGNYKKGTDEIIKLFYQKKDVALAQGQLYALMIDKDASVYIGRRLKSELESEAKNVNIIHLYLFYLRTTENFSEALKATIKLDDMTGGTGREILYFADRSRQDGQYEIAQKAYTMLIDEGRNPKYLPTALYGFARTLEQKFQSGNKFEKNEIIAIIDRYRQIIKKYPRRTNAADSRFRIASLALEHLKDYELAEKEFKNLINDYPKYKITAVSMNRLGQIYLIQNRLTDAKKTFSDVIQKFSRIDTNERDRAKYKLAEILFFEGQIDSSKTLFGNLTNNTNSDIANDALNKIVLIEQNKEMTLALKTFAKAEYLKVQNKFNQAIEKYLEVYEQAMGEDISEKSLVKVSEIKYKFGEFFVVRTYLEKLLQNNPKSIYSDFALFMIGNSYMSENKYDKAVKSYNEILIKHPRSIYSQEARQKIREIRRIKI